MERANFMGRFVERPVGADVPSGPGDVTEAVRGRIISAPTKTHHVGPDASSGHGGHRGLALYTKNGRVGNAIKLRALSLRASPQTGAAIRFL